MQHSRKTTEVTTNTAAPKKLALLSLSALLAVSMTGLIGCSSSTTASNTNTNNTTNVSSNTSNNNASSNSNANATANNTTTSTSTATSSSVITEVSADDPYASGIHHATVTVEGYSPFTITLDADSAPITVSNFANLVNSGYYNGLNFYRIQKGFCLQGGTLGNSTTGSDSSLSKIKGEFSSNDVDNPLADSFGRGTVAMARTTDVDSASSTFFVTLSSSKSVQSTLNGQYAAFGTIDEEGMQIVDQIVLDYASYADDNMGGISDESKQAHITGIVMVD